MSLFLRADLCKGPASSPAPKPPEAKTPKAKDPTARQRVGEQRGGKYVARVQIGYDKDGSPKYKYFRTQEEYKNWKDKQSKGNKKKKSKKHPEKNPHNLAQKVAREHRESKEKQGTAPRTAGSDPIKDNKTAIRKSLYVRL